LKQNLNGADLVPVSIQKKSLILTITALVVILVDQYTKYVVRVTPRYQNVDIIEGWLSFLFTKNPGMALGIDILDTFYVSLFALIATVVIIVYVIRHIQEAPVAFMYLMGLIIGGAIGNLIDRMIMGYVGGYGGFLEGHVVDFIFFNLQIAGRTVFPYIFNMADVAISCAVILFLVFNKTFFPDQKSLVSNDSDRSTASSVGEAEEPEIKKDETTG
jgi:signal peptidase II